MLVMSIGITAGILCGISFIPQVLKIYRTKQAQDISLAAFVTLSCGILMWLVYGILRNDIPVILANGSIIILSVSIVAMKIKYD